MILLVSCILLGCTHTQTIALNKTIILDYFYVESCGDCKAFKKNSIPKLQKTFGDQIIINQYDLDDLENESIYDDIINSLDQFDDLLYGQGPFIVVEDYFAIIGFESSETDILISDIVNATKGKELSDDLSIRRFMYR